MAKYLGQTGLVYLWGKIKNWVSNYVKITSSTGKDTITAGSNSIDVYDWAQASTKPSYTAQEVGALPSNTSIPSKTSDLTNDSGFITSNDIPEGAAASSTTPLMDGTAAKGTDNGFARGDHVHPTDTSRAASDHVHGNLTNDGKVTASGVDIANNDTLLIVDASDSSKVKQTNVKFDGSTATKALTQKGTFETFNNYSHPTTTPADAAAVKVGKDANGHVVLGGALGKSDVGLGNVDNKSSETIRGEITSGNVTSALGYTPVNPNVIGAASGVCPLDSNQKIDSQYLPSYVDDVIEAYIRCGQTALSSTWLATGSASGSAITPESGKIYVLMNSDSNYAENTEFRWGGTAYVKINDGGISEMTTAEMDTATSDWA